MNVWQPVDGSNIGNIVHRDDVEIFQSQSNQYWYRSRTPQETAELRMLKKERSVTPERLSTAK